MGVAGSTAGICSVSMPGFGDWLVLSDPAQVRMMVWQ
jgi:hypothetical protein